MSHDRQHGNQIMDQVWTTLSASVAPRVGRVSAVSGIQGIFVEWDNAAPKEARLLAGLSRHEFAKPECRGREVLLVFELGNPDRPIIVGLLQDPLDDLISREPREEPTVQAEVRIDGERIVIEGKSEVVLTCGEGSITLRKDGKILIKGTQLLSRATGSNRIKGGSVQIN